MKNSLGGICMKKLTTAVLLTASLIQPLAQGAEVDPHTDRANNLRVLSDSTNQMNYWINYYIKKQMNRVNNYGAAAGDCRIDPKKKVKELMIRTRKCLGGHWRPQCAGEITLYRRLKYQQYGALGETATSIYRDFGLLESPSLRLVSIVKNTMGAHFRMGDLMIGSDKFSHFFNRGRKYFKFYQKGASKEANRIHKGVLKNYGKKYSRAEVEEISRRQRQDYMLATGKHSEESLFGAKSTGVGSYGDLAANFAGAIFWNEFAGWGDDIRTLKPVPEKDIYMKCNQRTGKFEQKRTFDIRDYVNSTWDEGMNCSVYQTELQASNVEKRVNGLKGANAVHCPIDLERVRKEGKRFFGRFYDQVVKETPYNFIDKVIKADFGQDRLDEYGRYVGGMRGPKFKFYTKVPATRKIITTKPIITQEYHGNFEQE